MNERAALTLWALVAVFLALIGIFVGEGLTVATIAWTPLVAVSLLLCRRFDPGSKVGLISIFLVALAVRWLFAAIIHLVIYSSRPGLFSPDEVGYEYLGSYLGEYFNGHYPSPPDGSSIGVVWIVGACYYLFGYGMLVPKLLNGVAGGWTAVFTALIALRAFPPAVARRAGFIAALTPSLVLWSSLMTKDNWTLFGVEVALLAFLALRERFRPWLFVPLVLSLSFVATNRAYEVLFVAAGFAGSLLVGFRKHVFRNLAIIAGLGVAIVVIALRFDSTAPLFWADEAPLERVNDLRQAYTDAGSAVDIQVINTSTPLGLLAWLPFGLVYFFLAPIPFTGGSAISLATTPEMLIWYALLPSAYRGIRNAFRSRQILAISPVAFYALTSSIGWAIAITNVGSLFRYRGQILFFPIIAIAAEQIRRRTERLGRSPRSLDATAATLGRPRA